MVAGNEILSEFVSGSKNGQSTYFFCTLCERDVSMVSRGAGELVRHFGSDRHWERDVTYRVHEGLPIFNQLRQAITLTDEDMNSYRSCPFKKKAVGYLLPEDRLQSAIVDDGCLSGGGLAWRRQLHHASSFVGHLLCVLVRD